MLPMFEHEDTPRAREIVERLKPMVEAYWAEHDPARFKTDPYSVMLVSLFSPRTKTEQSRGAMEAIFALADTPAKVAQLSYEQLFDILQEYDVRFPENKARYVLDGAKKLVDEYDSAVPDDLDALMQFPGMGWKTALLTLWLAFGKAPQITVDIHVKRISGRLGLIDPKVDDPEKVSRLLMDIVPREYWGAWNSCMVYFGKTRCYPSNPKCNGCPLYDLCERIGV